MPRHPAPLPDAFDRRIFTTTEARAAGIPDKRMRAQDLSRPFRGVRAPARALSLGEVCRARALQLPAGHAFSHVTAARLSGLPVPARLREDPRLHVSVPVGTRAPRGRGTVGHQVALLLDDIEERDGLRVTTAARTFCDLAAILTLGELVAVGDRILRGADATPQDLAAAVRAWRGRRGRPQLLRAGLLLDPRSESPKESELRVLLIEAGFPIPECNVELRDGHGRFVARVDLAYPALRVALEYEGDHHRERNQWRRDIARRRRIEALGWTCLSVTQADLESPGALLTDLRRALRR